MTRLQLLKQAALNTSALTPIRPKPSSAVVYYGDKK
jgi:hypothetical protein